MQAVKLCSNKVLHSLTGRAVYPQRLCSKTSGGKPTGNQLAWKTPVNSEVVQMVFCNFCWFVLIEL